MPSAVIRISTRGVARTSRRLTVREQEVQADINEVIRDLGRTADRIFSRNSPSTRIADGLVVVPSPSRVELVSTFREKTSGYDPLGVTRFGHRKKIIRPRADRAPSSVTVTRAKRGPNLSASGKQRTQTALFFPDADGDGIFRHFVKGQTRRTDWVADSRLELLPYIDAASERLGRKVVGRLR